MQENIIIEEVSPVDRDFLHLVKQLDDHLALLDGSMHEFYDGYNSPSQLSRAIILKDNGQALACGGLKLDAERAEIKRMFTLPEHRRKGYAAKVLQFLENLSRESGLTHCQLETGRDMKGSIEFYLKQGYRQIPNFPPYEKVESSVCFEKAL